MCGLYVPLGHIEIGKGVAGRGYFILLRMSEREACCVATALSVLRPCRIHRKVYFPDYKMYLSKLANVFVHIFKCICLNLKCICRLATALSVARPCAIPSKVRNFTLHSSLIGGEIGGEKVGWTNDIISAD